MDDMCSLLFCWLYWVFRSHQVAFFENNRVSRVSDGESHHSNLRGWKKGLWVIEVILYMIEFLFLKNMRASSELVRGRWKRVRVCLRNISLPLITQSYKLVHASPTEGRLIKTTCERREKWMHLHRRTPRLSLHADRGRPLVSSA